MDSVTQALLVALFVALPMSMFWCGFKFAQVTMRLDQHDRDFKDLGKGLDKLETFAREAFSTAEHANHKAVEAQVSLAQHRRELHGGFVDSER